MSCVQKSCTGCVHASVGSRALGAGARWVRSPRASYTHCVHGCELSVRSLCVCRCVRTHHRHTIYCPPCECVAVGLQNQGLALGWAGEGLQVLVSDPTSLPQTPASMGPARTAHTGPGSGNCLWGSGGRWIPSGWGPALEAGATQRPGHLHLRLAGMGEAGPGAGLLLANLPLPLWPPKIFCLWDPYCF